jgi:hypothetical protein
VAINISGPKVDLDPLQGKIVHGGKLDGNQEESKKEETLTICETNFARAKNFNQPLERSTS